MKGIGAVGSEGWRRERERERGSEAASRAGVGSLVSFFQILAISQFI